MRTVTWLAAAALVVVLASRASLAQQGEPTNPLQGNAQAIDQGQQLFRLVVRELPRSQCQRTARTRSHDRSMDPRRQRRAVVSDHHAGHSGNGYARCADRGRDADQVWAVIAYLRTLSGPASEEDTRGNAQNGETLFWGKATCGQCHMVRGRGGRLGPDLSRIGATRSRTALINEIRTPSRSFTDGYWPVTVVARDGRRTRGVRKNEDPFSLQIMDTNERILSFDHSDLREVVRGTSLADARLRSRSIDRRRTRRCDSLSQVFAVA